MFTLYLLFAEKNINSFCPQDEPPLYMDVQGRGIMFYMYRHTAFLCPTHLPLPLLLFSPRTVPVVLSVAAVTTNIKSIWVVIVTRTFG